jgi:hypothetical protein
VTLITREMKEKYPLVKVKWDQAIPSFRLWIVAFIRKNLRM